MRCGGGGGRGTCTSGGTYDSPPRMMQVECHHLFRILLPTSVPNKVGPFPGPGARKHRIDTGEPPLPDRTQVSKNKSSLNILFTPSSRLSSSLPAKRPCAVSGVLPRQVAMYHDVISHPLSPLSLSPCAMFRSAKQIEMGVTSGDCAEERMDHPLSVATSAGAGAGLGWQAGLRFGDG